LLFAVSLNQSNLLIRPPSKLQILQRLFINREDATSSPIFRSHVGDRRAIGQRQILQPRPVILNKLPNHTVLTQHLRNGKDKVSSSSPFSQSPSKLHANHQRNQHRNRLSQHSRLSLNPTNTPTQNPQPIHHRRMTVCAYQRVRVGGAFSVGFVYENYSG